MKCEPHVICLSICSILMHIVKSCDMSRNSQVCCHTYDKNKPPNDYFYFFFYFFIHRHLAASYMSNILIEVLQEHTSKEKQVEKDTGDMVQPAADRQLLRQQQRLPC